MLHPNSLFNYTNSRSGLVNVTHHKILFLIFFLVSIVLPHNLNAQGNSTILDSLNGIINNNKQDTNLVNAYLQLAKLNLQTNFDSCITLNRKAMALARKLKWIKGIAETHKLQGIIYFEQLEYEQSNKQYDSALNLINEKEYPVLMSLLYNNLGNNYQVTLNYPTSLKYYFKALQINEKTKNHRGVALNCINIGVLYNDKLSNSTEGIRYHRRSMEESRKISDTELICESYSGIAIIYSGQKNYDSALHYYQKSLYLGKLIDNKRVICNMAANMGSVYFKQKKYQMSDSILQFAKVTAEQAQLKRISIKIFEIMAKNNIEKFKLKIGVATKSYLSLAKQYLASGIKCSQTTVSADTPHNYFILLSKVEELSGNYKNALYLHQRWQNIDDSLKSQEQVKQIKLLENERKEFEFKRLEDEKARKANNAKTIQLLSIFTGLLIIVSFIIFLTLKKINHRLLHFLGTLSVLAVFELVALFIHPFLEKITHHNLVLMLLALMLVAAFIIPLHHKVEHWVKDFIIKRVNAKKNSK